jgi:cytochrome c-type biogenesis protein CcsB
VRVPWGNMYEFTLMGTWVVVVGYLALYRRFGLSWLSPVVTSFVLVTLMIDVMVLYTPVVPLRDALQSPWLVIHVVAAIIATGAFTLGGMCSALFLVKQRWEEKHPDVSERTGGGYLARLPKLEVLDRIAYRTHAFGFPIWTFAALIAGPIWAHYAWGRYWGWDPKEIWAFITWVVYAAYLHARATSGWKGRSAAVVALVGMATLWFNFVGINFFFGSGSQHSYAAPEPVAVVRTLH